jgi:hypothetical protein
LKKFSKFDEKIDIQMQEDQILPTGITPKKPILKHNK